MGDTSLDYVKPTTVVQEMATAGKNKAQLTITEILIKAILSGAFLGYATTLAFTGATQTGFDIVGAIIFPTGFVMILLLNLELVTGSFAIIPIAILRKKTTIRPMLRNFFWAFIGNLLGSLLYAGLFVIYVTQFGNADITDSLIAQKIIAVAESKTNAYKAIGSDGMIVLFVKAILCNWMVTLGAVMAFTSKSTVGKIAAMWLPIFIFFAQGFEHAVVNMFAIPAGMMLGAEVTMGDWWLWNQIPVTIGNFIAGFIFTALALHLVTKNESTTHEETIKKAS